MRLSLKIQSLIQRLSNALIWLNSFIPEKLPQGMTEFNRWVDEISYLSGLPQNDKLRKVISQLIISLPPQMAYVKKRFVVNTIQKAAANQVAFEVVELANERIDQQEKCLDQLMEEQQQLDEQTKEQPEETNRALGS